MMAGQGMTAGRGLVQRIVAPAVAAVATGAVVAIGALVPQAAPDSTGPEVTIEPRTTAICSTDPEDPRDLELVAAALTSSGGGLALGDVEAQRAVGSPLDASGVLAAKVDAKPYTVTATGAMTQTAAGVLLGSGDDGTDRGLAAQACSLPGTQHWFVGLGARKAQFSTVLVSNPDGQAAEVELRVRGPRGPVTAPGSSGIAVPPHATRAIPLEGMVTEDGELAVEVRATAGRVAAVVQDRHRDGVEPAGTAWVGSSGTPRIDQVIPGIPGGAGDRDLVLVNPGERTSTVRVDALTASGSFTLKGADAVEVPPAGTVRVPLADALGGDEAALRIIAEQPVGAAVVATSTGKDRAADTATAVPTTAVRSPLVLPVAAAADVAGRVVLSNAGEDPTTATVVLRDRSGKEVGREELEIAAGSTTGLDVAAGAVWAEVTSDDAAELHAAVVLTSTRGGVAGLAWLPATSPQVGAEWPSVERDPRVAR